MEKKQEMELKWKMAKRINMEIMKHGLTVIIKDGGAVTVEKFNCCRPLAICSGFTPKRSSSSSKAERCSQASVLSTTSKSYIMPFKCRIIANGESPQSSGSGSVSIYSCMLRKEYK